MHTPSPALPDNRDSWPFSSGQPGPAIDSAPENRKDSGGRRAERRAKGRGTCPPTGTGRGRGPADASYSAEEACFRSRMTPQTLGGAGVTGGASRPERSSPAPLARAPPEPAENLTGGCQEPFENRWRLPECSSRPKNRDDGSKNSPKRSWRPQKWDEGSTSPKFAPVAGFRQNRAGRGALKGAVAGVALNGWPISGSRARRYALQTPGTKVSLHGFGGNPLRGTTRARLSNGEAQRREISPKLRRAIGPTRP